MRGDSHRDRFLANAEMTGRAREPALDQLPDHFLDDPDQQHRLQEAMQLGLRGRSEIERARKLRRVRKPSQLGRARGLQADHARFP